jgi:cytoskeletal protein CcmA (bactofilin family)
MFRRSEDERHGDPIEAREVRMKEAGKEVTVVGHGARLEGSVVSAGSLQVDGQVKGTITADGDVMLSAQSEVEADIHAQNVIVAGRFRGNIEAANRAELARGGRVDGNISSKVLVVAEGAVFSGQSTMDEGSGRPRSAPAGTSAAPAGPPQPLRRLAGEGDGPRAAERTPSP